MNRCCRYGSLPWSALVRPAAPLARDGFAAHPYLVYSMNGPSNSKRIAVRDIIYIRTLESLDIRIQVMQPTCGVIWI